MFPIRSMRDRDAPALAFLLGMSLALYAPPLFAGADLYFRDFQIFYVPMKHLLAEAMRRGGWLFWNTHVLGGTPFLADPQSGVLYPLSALLLVGKGSQSLALLLAAHVFLGLSGTYLFARHLGWMRAASLASAIVYGLGGWMVSSGNMVSVLQTAAWAPWVLLAFERLWRAAEPGRLALAAVTLALQVLAGVPDVVIMTGLVAMVRRFAAPGITGWRWLPYSGAACVIAALLCAPQLLAIFEAYTLSNRAGGTPTNALFEFSATAGQFRSLLFPPRLARDDWDILAAFPDGHVPLFLSLYLGWTAGVLALTSVARRNREALSWILVAGLGVFLALGPQNTLAVPLLKLLDPLRSPEKYLFLLHWGLAMCCGVGMTALVDFFSRRRGASWATGASALALVAMALELLVVNGRIDTLAPPGYYHFDDAPEIRAMRADPGRVYARSHAAERFNNVRGLYGAFREELSPNIGILAGIDYLNGTSFLIFRHHVTALRLIEGAPPDQRLANRLGFFTTRYVVTSDPAFHLSPSWSAAAQRISERFWILKTVAPRLNIPKQVLAAPDAFLAHAVDLPEFADGSTVFVPPGVGSVGHDFSGEVSETTATSNGVKAMVRTATGGLVVWREFAYPGWMALVDGAPVSPVRANALFMAAVIPPGQHMIEFRFEPTGWRRGWLLAGLGAAILAALAGLGLLNRRRGRPCLDASG